MNPRARIALVGGLALTATAACGSDTVVDLIDSLEDVEIRRFRAEPETIEILDSSTLSWRVDGATDCEILPDVGRVDADGGSVEVFPEQTTTYELVCEEIDEDDDFGEEVESRDTARVTVTVLF